ncbi:hypothetical protein [Hoylesella enoeca]|uniref:hypothetical protein n=1 Tax=Hoylesella enoeca TaxID=76123 RepID=UPI00288C3431|nr:hypothetical protein [Hoylesella enoeca]
MDKKIRKTMLRDAPTGKKLEKQCFGMPRRAKNQKNNVSAGDESLKIRKTTFQQVMKALKLEK